MQSLTASEWLKVWERGQALGALERTLLLLAAAEPEMSVDALAELPLGACNARLLELRERTFGRTLTSVATCPQCGTRLEAELDSSELRAVHRETPFAPIPFAVDRYRVQFRLPSTADLAVAAEADMQAARRMLLERVIVEPDVSELATGGAEAPGASGLPPFVLDAIAARMAEADPLASIRLALTCAHCGHAWEAALDIAAFLWDELDAWAQRILREVHTLASAYGWSEREILALSPQRRQAYLELVGG